MSVSTRSMIGSRKGEAVGVSVNPVPLTPDNIRGTPRVPSAGRGRGRNLTSANVDVSPSFATNDFTPSRLRVQSDPTSMLMHFMTLQQEERREERRIQEEREERRRQDEEKRWALLLQREEERRSVDVEWREEHKNLVARQLQITSKKEERETEEQKRREQKIEGLKILPFEEGKDNIDDYLEQFQRLAEIQGWKRETWSSHLLPYLRGTARSLFFALPKEQASDYDQLRIALLKRFNLTAEGYRQKFRNAYKETGETFVQFIVRIGTYLSKWTNLAGKDETNAEDLRDLILQEQFMGTMSTDLAIRVRERQPPNVKEAAEAADVILEAKKATRKTTVPSPNSPKNKLLQNTQGRGQAIRQSGADSSISLKEAKEKRLCFKCGKSGHVQMNCRKESAAVLASTRVTVSTTVPSLCAQCSQKPFDPHCKVNVDGILVDALRDTGSDVLVVDQTRVPTATPTGQKKRVALASSGHQVLCDTAFVHLDSPFFSGRALAVLMKDPIFPVIIGNYVQLETGEERKLPVYSIVDEIGAVETRSQARKGERQVEPLPVSKPLIGEVKPEEIARMQQEDKSLKRARENATSGQDFKIRDCSVHFAWKKSLLYRVYVGATGTYSQLVVPKDLRIEVMRLAHDSPMAGHMGAKRTRERIWSSFYWPGMCLDIRRYCSSCDTCQRTSPRGLVKKAPLERMPLIDEPFRRVAVDLVGPILPASDRGYRYILVMIDYATRYPEAVPLRNIDTETVAEALWEMWSRLGIPDEVLSDRGTQFVSGVMKEVQRLLTIQKISTSPYHAQTNGLVERFNSTLKSMLRKLCLEKPKKWDRYIPALLFAYREVPQESMGFAPFELLYGRTVRGPMQVLKQLWTREIEDENVRQASEYVVDLRNRIEDTCEIARKSLGEAAAHYKRTFDKRARQRNFNVGEKVLLLLPEKKNKLQMAWQGPFGITGKKGLNDYRVQVRKSEKLFHVNLLKKYIDRDEGLAEPVRMAALKTEEVGVPVATAVVEEEPEEVSYTSSEILLVPLSSKEGPEDVRLDPENIVIHSELRKLCQEFRDVLTDVPLRTTLDECEIIMSSDQPVRTSQYRLPHAMRDTIKEEVESMLNMGVIERTASPFSSPIVLVKKPDGKVRFCVDFRKLNRQVRFDAEPMPDVDFLFSKVGKAQYLSKLDLSKGYWQVPLRSEDRPKTAFTTPEGQFQWLVMPFGLKTAGAVFSRMMRKLLSPLQDQDIENFMDDVLIASETKERHIQSLCRLLQRLREVQLSARPSKCFLGFREIEYLGHRIGSGKMWPTSEKMEKIREAAQPSTKKELRAFLGLAGYYRRFVPNFSLIALPLTDKTKGSLPNKLEWDDDCEAAFQTLKSRLCSSPVVCIPQPELPFVLRTDASNKGLGAVLLQDQGNGLQPVAYASRKLLPAEINYAVIEKECLGIIWGVEKFEPYLYGRTFILETDHSPLQHLDHARTMSGRLTRWALRLQKYSFNVRVIPGRDNVGADYLSRMS